MPAATKDEKGKPYIESYGSKEKDGSPVRLGVMCPTTELWQTRVRETVLRLLNECGVKGVYIDQIARGQPDLCFDASHGHPLGGGHWWTEGYWNLLEPIRRAKPADCMLTTECNAEPYITGLRRLPDLALAVRRPGAGLPGRLRRGDPDVRAGLSRRSHQGPGPADEGRPAARLRRADRLARPGRGPREGERRVLPRRWSCCAA